MAGMSQERYSVIKRYIDEKRVICDLKMGTIEFPKSRNSKEIPYISKSGYARTTMLFDDGKYRPVGVHQIIAIAGGLNPVGKVIDHINGNKLDNRLCNLRILTGSENTLAAWHEQGLATKENRARNESSGKTNFSNRLVAMIKYCLAMGGSVTQIAMIVGCSHSRISDIKSGKTWKEIDYKQKEKNHE